ncbi:pentatricopeptide repeat-containing protein [Salix suchowensis]|nr:pentatricopeptide repeat-containing protein [Salix suchowensis]
MGINQRLYMIMQTPFLVSRSNISLDPIAGLLKRCLKFKALRGGRQVHAWLVTRGTDSRILSLNSKLVGMYASCGDLKSATLVFKRIRNPNVFALNWMVLASAFEGYYKEAIWFFCSMKDSVFIYNKYTFSVVLKAFVGLLDLNKGKEVHCMVKQLGFESDVCVANALVDMYSKCGCIGYARRVFDRMVKRDIVSWTSMISGYCNVKKIEEALVLFERMRLEGLEPNDFTRGDSDGAFSLLSKMTREGLVPDLVTWNAMIAGFVQGERAGDAFKLFQDMLVLGVKPNLVTVAGLLPACGMISSIQRGRAIHGLVYRLEFDISNAFIASALIDMYSECGSFKEARTVFEKIHYKNVASWNAMIGCYGKHGMVNTSIQLFERMHGEGIHANEVTLLCVLSACSHSGYVEKGLEIFWSMKERYMVDRKKEHYGCVVDMLSRSGRLVDAYELLKEMPIEVTKSIAGAFFNGYYRDVTRGDLKKPGSFAMLSAFYATIGEGKEVRYNMKKIVEERKAQKEPVFSQVEEKDELVGVEIEKENNEVGLKAV